MRLMGGISRGKYYALKKNPAGVLDQDKLQRISLLVGIQGLEHPLRGKIGGRLGHLAEYK